MRLPQTARVLVVDDNPHEALPIVLALGRAGVGCVYVRGNKSEELPTGPLAGIRVAFLDMDLGVGGDDRAKVGSLIGVLTRLLGNGPGNVVFVMWTKHPELVAPFADALASELPQLRPSILIPMEKTFDFEQREWAGEGLDLVKYQDEIGKVVTKADPLGVLWSWEQLVHDAASQTTQELGRLVSVAAGPRDIKNDPDDQRWLQSLSKFLLRLIKAAGRMPPDEAHAFYDLLEVLSAILADRMQHQASVGDPTDLGGILSGTVTEALVEERNALNTMLLVEIPVAGDTVVRPGNVYLPRSGASEKCPFSQIEVDRRGLVRDMLKNDAQLKKALSDLQENERTGKKAQADEARSKVTSRIDELSKECQPALLEITPECDFAQAKQRVARLLLGLLVPIDLVKAMTKSDSTISVVPVSVPGLNKEWVLVFDARYQFGIGNPSENIGVPPVLRLRQHLLAHIQSKVVAHGARRGYLTIT